MPKSLKHFCLDSLGNLLRKLPFAPRLAAFCDSHRLGLRPFPRLSSHLGPKFQILIYHRVVPETDPFAITPCPTADFRAQMRVLHDYFHVVPLREMVTALTEGRSIPGAVAITFDDGYRDNHDHAFPILREFGLPATIFLATDFIGTGAVPWHDRVLADFRDATAARFAFPDAGIAEMDFTDRSARCDAAFRVLGWLKRFTPSEREVQIARLKGKCAPLPADGPPLMLDWDQVRTMRANGIAFGAHTMSHPIISRLPAAEMEKEIQGSKAVIERELGEKIDLFAYPNGQPGDYNEVSRDLVRQGGFACALTTSSGVVIGGQDPYALLRRQVWDPDVDGFFFRMLAERLAA
ncbi:MAG: polysaccharide deacetylase family protein [Fibrobacteres bacterium]|nr:polysaccharide deacetylase family protein [Fibrobacterota bacterium]